MDDPIEYFKQLSEEYEKTTRRTLPREEWNERRKRALARYDRPVTVRIVCSHKDGALLNKRPATLGEAIVETSPRREARVTLDWNPSIGNLNNRMNRKGHYHPVAIDEAIAPPDEEEMRRRGIDENYVADHDREGMNRAGVKGRSKTRRNAVTNYYADQFICPRCTMHVSRNHDEIKRLIRAMAKDGMGKLDIQHIDALVALLPSKGYNWR